MGNLNDTKTHDNLKAAFAGECQANRRYLYFAKVADIEGYPEIASNFRETAEGETGHAHGHLDYLKDVGDPATGLPIGETLENLNHDVWDRGYYKESDDGIWYEVYVNQQIKKNLSKINLKDKEQKKVFGKFNEIMLNHYEDDNQITFFVPNDETKYTLDELTNILI